MAIGLGGFLVLAGMVGVACSSASVPKASTAGGAAPATGRLSGPALAAPRAAPAFAGGGAEQDQAVAVSVPALQEHIVKTASISLSLKKGSFAAQFQQASLIAASHGGFVADSETETGKLRSGTLVLRIPADQFETALADLRGLGTLRSERISGTDVTGQFVDLQARLRNWEAQESVLLRLFDRATTIDDSIKVERQLQDVQLAIEEIRGQLHALSDQSDLSTVTVWMAEAGAVPAPPKTASALARAWHQAVHGFVSVIAAVVVGAGYLLPFVAMGLAIGLVWLVARRRRVRPEASPAI